MLKPVSAFVYVFQDASIFEAGPCVALSSGVGEDCVFCENELHDAKTSTRIRITDRFFIINTPKRRVWAKPSHQPGVLCRAALRLLILRAKTTLWLFLHS